MDPLLLTQHIFTYLANLRIRAFSSSSATAVAAASNDLPVEVCEQLLKEDVIPECEPGLDIDNPKNEEFFENLSYGLSLVEGKDYLIPERPYYKVISKVICLWANTGAFPHSTIKIHLLDELEDFSENLDSLKHKVEKLKFQWTSAHNSSQYPPLIAEFFQGTNVRHVLTLLGMRQTVGSLDLFPPSMMDIFVAFNRHHELSKNNRLTVGGRALSKHSHRDASTSWWGVCTGTEKQKNTNANKILVKIFSSIGWLNLHQLPHDMVVFEIRHTDGYGSRCSLGLKTDAAVQQLSTTTQQLQFRGFLEPPMENGHEIGWRH